MAVNAGLQLQQIESPEMQFLKPAEDYRRINRKETLILDQH
jgi:hypothetical protein